MASVAKSPASVSGYDISPPYKVGRGVAASGLDLSQCSRDSALRHPHLLTRTLLPGREPEGPMEEMREEEAPPVKALV